MKFSIDSYVNFSEAGPDGRITLGKIIDYFQDSTIMQSELLGGGLRLRKERNRAWLLNSWDIHIKERPELAKKIRVTTWPSGFSKVFGFRCFTMAYQDAPDMAIAEGASEWFLIDIEKENVVRITDEETKVYECEAPFGWESKSVRIQPAAEYEAQPKFSVARYQLDLNSHMNNAWYVKLALEYLSPDADVVNIRAVYKKAAKYGDDIYPFVAKEGKRTVVELRSGDDKIFATMEFVER